jgi:hypothetical protein
MWVAPDTDVRQSRRDDILVDEKYVSFQSPIGTTDKMLIQNIFAHVKKIRYNIQIIK